VFDDHRLDKGRERLEDSLRDHLAGATGASGQRLANGSGACRRRIPRYPIKLADGLMTPNPVNARGGPSAPNNQTRRPRAGSDRLESSLTGLDADDPPFPSDGFQGLQKIWLSSR